MPEINMKELLEAGVHFGHQTQRWNPKMSPFIFTQRGGIHIFDLAQTKKRLEDALDFIKKTVSSDKIILFIGTKKQAKEIIREKALRCGMPYISERWLGGMFTNFTTISKRLTYLKELESKKGKGEFNNLTKKERAKIDEEIYKLSQIFSGIKDLKKVPDAVFIMDVHEEDTAVKEAKKLNIPIVGVVDSNADPDGINYLIPGNDDALKSIKFITKLIADTIIENNKTGNKKEVLLKKEESVVDENRNQETKEE